MVIGERVKERLEAAGISQTELARRLSLTQGTIAKLVSGNAQGSSHLHRIARELQTTPEYLTGEIDDPDAGALPAPTPQSIADQLDAVMVPELDLAYGMGGTFIDEHAERRIIPFPRAWLRRFTSTDPEHLAFVKGTGDSMQPTIQDGDLALLDLTKKSLDEQDVIWAISFGEFGMIKRIRSMPDGTYKIMSDNAAVESERAVDEEMHIVGRVVAVIRKM